MKALEKDRNRRYETANGLAMDLRRHLDHEPVLAGPPSAAYKLSKFVRRNRVTVAAGSVVALSLIAAAAVSVGFAFSEAEQRRLAATERDTAKAVNEFLTKDLLAAVAPSAEKGKGKDVLMRDVLDEAVKRGLIDEAGDYETAARGADLVVQDDQSILATGKNAANEMYELIMPVETAIQHLRSLPADVDPELLKSAVKNPTYAYVAVQTMGSLRNPAYIETLGACINPDWIYDNNLRGIVVQAATSALAGYLSDEAAETLLRGMSMATERNVRYLCAEALDSIKAYEDQLRSWEERKERRLERDDAVVQLLELLRDPDSLIRAEAARGLGTLGAVEYIPRLIEMLRDSDP
ncbi:MAG: HEAT repeat domain-containing protein, partial [Planctomycetes bacterium]|nr:HEAT repeat domain-containing protein [Planctomycetota bacterium]